MFRPPEEIIKMLVPILCKIVGISFIVGGIIFLPIGCMLLFKQGENTKLVGSVFIGGSVINILLGFVVIKNMPNMPGFMLDKFRKLRDNKWI